jgi:hypothetical protein
MRLTTKYFVVGAALVIIFVLVFFSFSYLINAGSNQISEIYVRQVTSAPNLASPGSEAFWNNVPSYSVPLIESIPYPPAGATSSVEVQMAWTSATSTPELLIKMTFPNAGPASSIPQLYNPPTKVPMVNDTALSPSKIVPIASNSSCYYTFDSCYGGTYPQDLGFLPLASGTSYVYPEQAMVLLGISPAANTSGWYDVSYKPKLVPGTSGAMSAGPSSPAQTELWLWSTNPTDNSSSDTGYPGLYFPNGSAVSTANFGLPAGASYAMDGYMNATSFYQLGGLPQSSPTSVVFPFINDPHVEVANDSYLGNLLPPLMNPFEVQAKGAYSSSHGWTVEFARPLTTPGLLPGICNTANSQCGESAFQLQMNHTSSQQYHIAFAVSQGLASETYLLYYNSVSFWWKFQFTSPNGFAGYNNNFGGSAILNHAGMSMGGLLTAIFLLAYVFGKTRETPTVAPNVKFSRLF